MGCLTPSETRKRPPILGTSRGEHTGVYFLTAKSVACLALGGFFFFSSLNHDELPRPELVCKQVSGTQLSTAWLRERKEKRKGGRRWGRERRGKTGGPQRGHLTAGFWGEPTTSHCTKRDPWDSLLGL